MTYPVDQAVVEVAREAMRGDAAKWCEAADVMERAALDSASFSLTGFHIGYIANSLGVGEKYTEVQALATRLLAEGAAAMREIELALLKAMEEYDRADESISDGFGRIGG